jgi:hypothetical protein
VRREYFVDRLLDVFLDCTASFWVVFWVLGSPVETDDSVDGVGFFGWFCGFGGCM